LDVLRFLNAWGHTVVTPDCCGCVHEKLLEFGILSSLDSSSFLIAQSLQKSSGDLGRDWGVTETGRHTGIVLEQMAIRDAIGTGGLEQHQRLQGGPAGILRGAIF
jgi:hypothetical protein